MSEGQSIAFLPVDPLVYSGYSSNFCTWKKQRPIVIGFSLKCILKNKHKSVFKCPSKMEEINNMSCFSRCSTSAGIYIKSELSILLFQMYPSRLHNTLQ